MACTFSHVLVCLLFIWTYVSGRLPCGYYGRGLRLCNCMQMPEVLRCQNSEITRLPEFYPAASELRHLDLHGSSIRFLADEDLKIMVNLELLDLSRQTGGCVVSLLTRTYPTLNISGLCGDEDVMTTETAFNYVSISLSLSWFDNRFLYQRFCYQ